VNLRAALEVLQQTRTPEDVVITTMGAAREWMALGPTNPMDLVFVPSAMGQATSVGLGLALARPDHRIIVVNGDGSMLMNLGSLVTITAEQPSNLVLIVCDNGVYEVTGAQPTPASPSGRLRGDRLDFLALARAAGFSSLFRCSTLPEWRERVHSALDRAGGPTFVLLDVDPVAGARGPRSPGPAPARARQFMAAVDRLGSCESEKLPESQNR
jgi:thiamine pyrophosphate-dependent acetolactate synthase large subunit-like protein